MDTLLVGFDSAWTAGKRGALVGVLQSGEGRRQALGEPQAADFAEAAAVIRGWQAAHAPHRTLVLLDQPTIVVNAGGQRPVEHLLSSCVSRRRGAIQPANTARAAMFGPEAPLWSFLASFGGAGDPRTPPATGSAVYETYPVLTLVALDAVRPDPRAAGRLPKYNPARRATFTLDDWRWVCRHVADEFAALGLPTLAAWAARIEALPAPRKADQDRLDAGLCLLAALHWQGPRGGLMIGEPRSGHLLVPHAPALQAELDARCQATGRTPADWVHALRPTVG